jgi:hypothetical protein
MPSKLCPFADCETKINAALFCCMLHWQVLTHEEQRLLSNGRTHRMQGRITAEEYQAMKEKVLEAAEQRLKENGR